MLEAHEAGTDLRDQAVLVRSAHHSDVLEIELSARGIPVARGVFGAAMAVDLVNDGPVTLLLER